MSKMGSKLIVALVALAFLAVASPVDAKGGAGGCYHDDIDVYAYAAVVDANTLLGTNNHHALVQFVVDAGDASRAEVYIKQWGRDGRFELTYDETDGLWKSDVIVNPTPEDTLVVEASAYYGSIAGYYRYGCGEFEPVL